MTKIRLLRGSAAAVLLAGMTAIGGVVVHANSTSDLNTDLHNAQSTAASDPAGQQLAQEVGQNEQSGVNEGDGQNQQEGAQGQSGVPDQTGDQGQSGDQQTGNSGSTESPGSGGSTTGGQSGEQGGNQTPAVAAP